MTKDCPRFLLNASQILKLTFRMLAQINFSIGKCSCETAFIVQSILTGLGKNSGISKKDATLLSLFYLYGFLHFYGEKPVHFSELTHGDIYHSFLYGYYYLKEMSPLGENAKALLFYDAKYNKLLAKKVVQLEYASLLFSSSSIYKLIHDTKGQYSDDDFFKYGFSKFNPLYFRVFRAVDSKRIISQKILNGSYLLDMDSFFDSLDFTKEETEQLFKMMVYIMDFKSTQTLQHVIHTASYAASIGIIKNLSDDQINELFTAGILHDTGKISIPNLILESTEKLSAFEFAVIKMHVEETENILKNIVPENVFNMALHHHEKLNGTGYPNKLFAKDLTKEDQILTIADIFSALIDKRSYKGKFSLESILKIYTKMADDGEIDKNVPTFIRENFNKLESDKDLFAIKFAVPLGLVEIQYQEEILNEFGEQKNA